jgi:hypothetical protein
VVFEANSREERFKSRARQIDGLEEKHGVSGAGLVDYLGEALIGEIVGEAGARCLFGSLWV